MLFQDTVLNVAVIIMAIIDFLLSVSMMLTYDQPMVSDTKVNHCYGIVDLPFLDARAKSFTMCST